MTIVVDNLQQYFMADVLESQFSILIRSVDQSTNFEDLSIAHDNFLAAVLTHTFVNNKAVSCRLKDQLRNETRNNSIQDLLLLSINHKLLSSDP